jgi:nucleoside-diphosphate-sugar epimerase
MNVLVTGGCGFIGLKFAKRLLEKKHSVYLMDVNAEPLKKQIGLEKVTFIPGTITCQAHLVNALKEHKIQWLAHLAARLSAPSEEDPWSTFEVNVRGLYHALEAARICGVERFVFTSSLASYGLHLPPVVDDVTIQRPIGMYGVTKVFGEQLGAFYRRRFGLDFRCIRFAQIIGPGVKTPGVAQCMPMVIEAAAKGETFEMWIEEESTMPLLYYKDGVEALSCLTHAPKENILTISYNLAGIKTSAAALVRSIRAIVPDAKIKFTPDPAKVAIVKTIPSDIDDSRLRQETGYRPMFDLDAAVKDFIREVRSGNA